MNNILDAGAQYRMKAVSYTREGVGECYMDDGEQCCTPTNYYRFSSDCPGLEPAGRFTRGTGRLIMKPADSLMFR